MKDINTTVELVDLNELINRTNLKHVECRGWFKVLKNIFGAFKNNYGKLKTLKLSVIDGENLFFKFPEDGSQWKPTCDYFDRGFIWSEIIQKAGNEKLTWERSF